MNHTRRIFLTTLALAMTLGLRAAEPPLYFPTAEKAVAVAEELVRQQDWKTLARYYDLTGSDAKLADLESGDFFVCKERPANADPMGFWKTKHPFPPGFKFAGIQATTSLDVLKVNVAIEIDQGGGPKQRSVQSFLLKKKGEGYQILPPAKETK